MMTQFRILFCAIALVFAAAGASAESRPVTVVELYTSQGCHSCPPADEWVGKVVDREDILALSLHVDYWDYIGWKDKFALPGNADRQRKYARHLGMGYVYTPQLVVQGMAHTSSGPRAGELIRELRGAKRLDVKIAHDGNGLKVDVPGGTFDEEARILVAAYDSKHVTNIKRGENAGKELAYYNVVRDFAQIGSWKGEAVSMMIDEDDIAMKGHDGCAVLIQSVKTGRILGAAAIELDHQS